MLLQFDTGIRPKEALSLLTTDVNIRSLEVYIKAENAKTRIARTLPVSPFTESSQKTMGHADLNMTKRYVALTDDDIKEQHMKASPVSNLIKPKTRIGKISKTLRINAHRQIS